MPNFPTTDLIMAQTLCGGCNRYFKGNRGLPNHFQYNKKCKTIHLNLMQQYQIVSSQVTQVDNDRKTRAVTETQKSNINQCELNQAYNDMSDIKDERIVEDSSINTAPFASLDTEEEESIEPINILCTPMR